MLEAIGKESWWNVTSNDIDEFPCTDLRTIDTLWVKYSNGRFGFSVQKRIWESVGGKPGEGDYKIYKKFADRIGWYVKQKDEWLSRSNLSFTLNAAEGHLPSLGHLPYIRSGQEMDNADVYLKVTRRYSLFSRIETCKV